MGKPQRAIVSALLGVAFAASGCNGLSLFEGNGSDDGSGPGGANGGKGSEIIPRGECGANNAALSSQRLTKLEYNNVVSDLFGIQGNFSANFTDPPPGAAGFTTESLAHNLTSGVVLDFYNGANAVADALFAQPNNTFLTCSAGDDCATTLIQKLSRRAYRRKATSAEFDQLFKVYKAAPNFNDGMKNVVTTVMLAPQLLFRTYNEPTNGAAEVTLEGNEVAARLSFFLWGSIPDETLLAGGKRWGMAQGQHLSFRMNTDVANLYFTIANKMGIPGDSFSRCNTILDGVFA